MKRSTFASYRFLFSLLMVGIFLFASLGVSHNPVNAQDNPTPELTSVEVVSPYLTVQHLTLPDGRGILGYVINGPSKPPVEFEAERQSSIKPLPSTGTIANFPSYNWVFGCSAVSGSMIAGYYDNHGYPNMYTGPTNGGVMPLSNNVWPTWSDGYETYPNNPLTASHKGIDGRTIKGSIDDYWVKYQSTASDPYITGSWTQHTAGPAIGDYMKTSQSAFNNTDGSTTFFTWVSDAAPLTCADMVTNSIQNVDGTYGRKLFYEARGYTVTDCYNQKTDNNSGGFTLAMFQAQIDSGNPVLLNLAGHSIVGYGYSGSTIYVRDTWDSDPSHTYTMPWGGTYGGMQLLSVSVVRLQASNPVVIPTPQAPSGTITDTTPTYKWSKITGATQYRFRVYKGTSTTPLYTKTITSPTCTTTSCTNTPTNILALASYKWQVQAMVGGVWKAWSGNKAFTVAAPIAGFQSPFTSNATGWSKVSGTWTVAGGYYKSGGLADTGASVVHVNNYPTLTYTVKVKRTVGTTANRVIIRGTTTPLWSTNLWYKGYVFQWANDKYISVYKTVNGVNTAKLAWTYYSGVKPYDWNVIKITASGPNLKFYINGSQVWSGTDSSLTTGRVGIGFYRDLGESTSFMVDYANLATTVSSSLADEPLAELGESHPDWTSIDYAGPPVE